MRKEQVLIPFVRQVVQRPWLAKAMFRFDPWGNPFAEDTFRDPYPSIERARAGGWVTYRALYQQWFVFGYEEARQVLASPDVTVSGQADVALSVRPYTKLTPLARRFFANFLLLVDPPDHTRLRRLVSKAFTPRRVRELEAQTATIVEDLLAELRGDAVVDLVAGFNVKLPVNVIATMLGVPAERWDWARRTTSDVATMLDPIVGFDPDVVSAAVDDVFAYYGELADERRANPADDLITALVEAEDEGDRLDHEELITMIAFLMGAGHETTAGLLGNAVVALAANPDQRALVREHPELWPNATEELIRYDSSVRMDPRVAAKDLVIGDVTIPAGSNIIVNLNSANRDPRRFDQPDELRLDRENPDPISFGHGIHHCLGAALARLELRVGLRAFVEEFGDYTIDVDAVQWRRSGTLRGPTHLPVARG